MRVGSTIDFTFPEIPAESFTWPSCYFIYPKSDRETYSCSLMGGNESWARAARRSEASKEEGLLRSATRTPAFRRGSVGLSSVDV
jgi:hypothetical protein